MICSTCKEDKPETAFWVKGKGQRQTQCGKCAYHQKKLKQYLRDEYFAKVRPNLVR